jgi:hypothetical protein
MSSSPPTSYYIDITGSMLVANQGYCETVMFSFPSDVSEATKRQFEVALNYLTTDLGKNRANGNNTGACVGKFGGWVDDKDCSSEPNVETKRYVAWIVWRDKMRESEFKGRPSAYAMLDLVGGVKWTRKESEPGICFYKPMEALAVLGMECHHCAFEEMLPGRTKESKRSSCFVQ